MSGFQGEHPGEQVNTDPGWMKGFESERRAAKLEQEQEIDHKTDGDQKHHVKNVHSLVGPPGWVREENRGIFRRLARDCHSWIEIVR